MRHSSALWVVVLIFVGSAVRAEEGMWRPRQLPEIEKQLTALGMEADPAALSDLLGHPLNAVIWLGNCTASFISPQGLLITNHHCAFSSIQHNSTPERNLLRDGFLARTQGEELPAAPGSRVLVTVAVDDVTERVLGAVPDGASGLARFEAIENETKRLIADCEKDAGHRCNVASYYGDLEYELIKQLEIRDVRLVHAPPGSIGKYGGDVDNWMWPRHTGDYSFYRAYVSPGGRPADFARENVPFQPKHFLKVASSGPSEGDFAIAAGYPGTTNRYRLSSEVRDVIDWYYPTRMQAYGEWLEIVKKETAERPDAGIKYASLVASLNNSAKNYDGMLNGFARSDVVERKQAQEAALQNWIEGNPDRSSRYLSTLENLRKLVSESQANSRKTTHYGYFAQRSALLGAARTLYRLSKEREKPDMERTPEYQDRDITRIRERMQRISQTFTPEVDRAVWEHFLQLYRRQPAGIHVAAFDEWFGDNYSARLDEMYAQTELGDEAKRLAWMDASPAQFEQSNDPFIQLAVKLYESDLEQERYDKDLSGRLSEVRPQYMRALMAYHDSLGQALYPDANSTLRVTYGTLQGYAPRDGVYYSPLTTLRGIIEKDTGQDPFDAPSKQLELIRDGEFGGHFVEELDSVPVNFLTTLDATGGNSGSATLNSKGELVGLLFDGNWESIIADWDFIPPITRTIHVDMRYVLWIMEHIAGADNLIEEMGL